ncbi:protein of unknown function [Streptomyces sp. TLI_053]|uniref:DUF397 domain-containing protein n=1 Tax=Streptomyces sp. TLI_053 TaxID=1855352 RepID=UPI00087CAA99|nr:DUF397 domain-containing protein [Streptomyces sp. TLI_053]SDT72870.1 protein of unknown function [Streptomyces sp. TLI_053]
MAQLDWQKSSFSGDDSNCVEIRTGDGLVELRESDDGDTVLHTTPAAFASLLRTIKADRLDHPF